MSIALERGNMKSIAAAAAQVAITVFATARNNALAGVAFAVLLLFAFTLYLSTTLLASSPAKFEYFAVFALALMSMAMAVLIVVAQQKTVKKR